MDHRRTQGMPVGKEKIGGDGVQDGEKGFAGAQDGAGLLPEIFHAVARRVNGERQQIQQHKLLR